MQVVLDLPRPFVDSALDGVRQAELQVAKERAGVDDEFQLRQTGSAVGRSEEAGAVETALLLLGIKAKGEPASAVADEDGSLRRGDHSLHFARQHLASGRQAAIVWIAEEQDSQCL